MPTNVLSHRDLAWVNPVPDGSKVWIPCAAVRAIDRRPLRVVRVAVVPLPTICMEAMAARHVTNSLAMTKVRLVNGARIGLFKDDRWRWRCCDRSRRRRWWNRFRRACCHSSEKRGAAERCGAGISATISFSISEFLTHAHSISQVAERSKAAGAAGVDTRSVGRALNDIVELIGR